MQWNSRFVCTLAIACVASWVGVSAQRSTTTETRQFEIVAVDGNRVVVKDAQGAKEITVSDDFRLTVDGQPVTVRDLKPGMKGTATITTTTTMTPVYVTEVRNAEVLRVSGNSILVKGENGFREFTESEIEKRGIQMVKDGRPAKYSDFHSGDRLTATIVTTGPPKVLTDRQVQASLASAAAAAAPAAAQSARAATAAAPAASSQSARAAAAPPSSVGTGGPTASAPAQLPKTASSLPLIGLIGGLSLALGIALTLRRRRVV